MRSVLEHETETTFDTIHPDRFQRLPVRDVDAESLRPEFKGGHDVPQRSRPEVGILRFPFGVSVSPRFVSSRGIR